MARFTARVAMRWQDMDAYGHVNNVQFLTYVEEARVEEVLAAVQMDRRADDPVRAAATARALQRQPVLRLAGQHVALCDRVAQLAPRE